MQRNNGLLIDSDMHPGIIVDMDDVVCNTCDTLQTILTLETGTDIPVSDWHDHHLQTSYPMLTNKDIDAIIENHNVFSVVDVLPGVVEALSCLRHYGYNIHLCTARANVTNHKQLTHDWLTKHDIPYDTVDYVQYGKSKSQTYNTIADKFCYLFDDAIHNIDDAIASRLVIKPVIVTKPWNIKHTGVLRTNGLFDFCRTHGLL